MRVNSTPHPTTKCIYGTTIVNFFCAAPLPFGFGLTNTLYVPAESLSGTVTVAEPLLAARKVSHCQGWQHQEQAR